MTKAMFSLMVSFDTKDVFGLVIIHWHNSIYCRHYMIAALGVTRASQRHTVAFDHCLPGQG